ncbi:hypothetical protein Y032_0154g2968 [Ancylostoma ceylanicum]|uniref:Peptidase C1A papain C-terminal domain-containing protein n=1 Tax=Ancylostoma ceylanicum TaxID=53326 RepID=A0A016SZU5_9BILA|nr:hypothetical protein Y032_0154g2968 [Ancylostoma ceylanicum]
MTECSQRPLASVVCILVSCLSATLQEDEAARTPHIESNSLMGKALVDYVNANQQLFKAEANGNEEIYKHKLMDVKFAKRGPTLEEEYFLEDSNDTDIPESFDARVQWPDCPSLTAIQDQANCGSCWAVASAETMSDRVCIASNGRKKVTLSAEDLLSCCWECTFFHAFACVGGWTMSAWRHFVRKGVCTGGAYGEQKACMPYEFPPCGHHTNQTYYGECNGFKVPQKCMYKCQDGYPVNYNDDKTYGKKAYAIPQSVSAIQRDIIKNGPVVAGFRVFEDLVYYKTGIYKHTAGKAQGGHAVKIIGWGVENDVPYWIIANSWNTDWGEDGGFHHAILAQLLFYLYFFSGS